MVDRAAPGARELVVELDRLTHPFAEAMSDRSRLDAFVAVGVRAAAALRAAGPSADDVQREAWQPIETAPYGEFVEIDVGGMTFSAILIQNASEDSEGMPCDQWHAKEDGCHPPCWSRGACWESNEDDRISRQPIRWRALT